MYHYPRHSASPLRWHQILLLLAACTCGVLILDFISDPGVRIATLCTTAVLTFAACRPANRDIFHPDWVIIASTLVYMVLKPILMYRDSDLVFQGYTVRDTLALVVILATIAALGFFTGTSIRYRPKSSATQQYEATLFIKLGLALSVIGAVCYIAYGVVAGFGLYDRVGILGSINAKGSSVGYLFEAQTLATPASCMLIAGLRRRRLNVTSVCMILLLLVLGIASGFRARMVMAIAPAAIVWYLRKRSRPKLATGIVLITGAMLSLAILTVARSRTDAPAHGMDQNVLDPSVLLGDTNIVPAFARIVKEVPDSTPYLKGSSFTYIPFHVLPRAWFPDKGVSPEIELVWRLTGRQNGFAYPFLGMLYVNFGAIGVFLGFLLLGWIANRIYTNWRRQPKDPFAQAYLAIFVVFLFVMWPRPHVAASCADAVFLFAPLALARWIATLRGRSRYKGVNIGRLPTSRASDPQAAWPTYA